jgi:cellulose synthase/poly-beta-1,6-N-acetylglucosamine synthase-like glycosyltransferase
MAFYIVRQFFFTMNRMIGEQKMYYQDIMDSDMPRVTVLVPMHNEELVALNVLERLLDADYPKEKLEVIPINDHSEDRTKEIVDKFSAEHPFIKPLHRYSGRRGKPAAINEALQKATGEVIIVFDADYRPPRGILRDIAVCFKDPEIGAVMGRVVPENVGTNLLTRMLDIERSGGYQVDQQARYNLGLVPQYGGTVGGFRKDYCMEIINEKKVCFDPNILTEDTELTFKLYLKGRKVAYANRAECYEEAPEDWEVRGRQIRRWARGHTQVMYRYLPQILSSKMLNRKQKLDGVLLLVLYAMPTIFFGALIALIVLFFLGDPAYATILPIFFLTVAFNAFGNFSAFFEIGAATFIDGSTYRVRLLPFLMLNVFFNGIYISDGFVDATLDHISGRRTVWQKTMRFRKQ